MPPHTLDARRHARFVSRRCARADVDMMANAAPRAEYAREESSATTYTTSHPRALEPSPSHFLCACATSPPTRDGKQSCTTTATRRPVCAPPTVSMLTGATDSTMRRQQRAHDQRRPAYIHAACSPCRGGNCVAQQLTHVSFPVDSRIPSVVSRTSSIVPECPYCNP